MEKTQIIFAITCNNTPVIWKNLVSQIFVTIEFDSYLNLLGFFSSVEQVKVGKTFLGWLIFVWKILVTRVLKKH